VLDHRIATAIHTYLPLSGIPAHTDLTLSLADPVCSAFTSSGVLHDLSFAIHMFQHSCVRDEHVLTASSEHLSGAVGTG